MNQALTGADVSTTTSTDNWMTAFSGLVSSELDAAATTTTRCRSLTTISVSDLDQLDPCPGQACHDQPAVENLAALGSIVTGDRQRLSGLPLKQRYKQTKKQSATSHQRR